MNILITGGSGLIGRALIHKLALSHQIILLTRDVRRGQSLFQSRPIECVNNLKDVNIDTVDAVINLAGESIGDKRWSRQQKDKICNSRWQITRDLNQLIDSAHRPPSVMISGSAIGYYGRQNNQQIDENYSKFNDEFTHEVCQEWERLAFENLKHDMRVCVLRTGIVLSASGGALPKMALPFKFGVGAIIGDGQQYMSWIHIDDMTRLIIELLDSNLTGVVHATAPGAVTNQQFSHMLAKTLHRPCWFKLPTKLMTLLMGEQADLVIYGQRVLPQKLLNHGFKFTYPELNSALDNIYSKSKL